MTARKPGAKPRNDFGSIPGFSDLSKDDKRLFRINYRHKGCAYTIEQFRARRCNSKGCEPTGRTNSRGVPDSEPQALRRAHQHYCVHVRERDYWDWKAQYEARECKSENGELTDRDRAMIARNVQVTKERIEAKLRRMCA